MIKKAKRMPHSWRKRSFPKGIMEMAPVEVGVAPRRIARC
jgi:hypothetical protein